MKILPFVSSTIAPGLTTAEETGVLRCDSFN